MDKIRVIIFKEGEHWIAQCLEYDIVAQGSDLDTVRDRLLMTVKAEALAGMEFNGAAFSGIDPAPLHFQEMWEKKATTFRDHSSVNGDHQVTVELALAA